MGGTASMIKFAGNAGHMPGADVGAYDPIQPEQGDFIETKEAEWCKEVMQTVCDKLNDNGHDALFIQNDSLEAICNMSDAFGAEVFVSLHLNAAGSTEALGPETFYYLNSENGRRLANCVHNLLVQKLGAHGRDRGVKQANFHVLRETKATAILVEAGFITNVWEEATLHEPWIKRAVADAIVEGVFKYMGREE